VGQGTPHLVLKEMPIVSGPEGIRKQAREMERVRRAEALVRQKDNNPATDQRSAGESLRFFL
jgi:hypothetical protein